MFYARLANLMHFARLVYLVVIKSLMQMEFFNKKRQHAFYLFKGREKGEIDG